MCFGDKQGEWVKEQEINFGRIDGKKTFAVTGQAENLTVNADITAEEDGLLKTDFRSINEDAKEITLNESFKEIEDYLDGADCKSENGKTVIPVEYTSLKIIRVTK